MYRLLLVSALMVGCEVSTQPNQEVSAPPLKWLFQMPNVHDTYENDTIPARGEYLLCADSLHNGTICDFRGVSGAYEESGDWSFLDTPDSSIQWPNRDRIRPLFVGRVP